jgi:hypothetical protein
LQKEKAEEYIRLFF